MRKLMLYLTVASLPTLIFVRCSEPHKKPTDLIDADKMANVLVDVRVLEGLYGIRVNRMDTMRQHIPASYDVILQKHGITRDQFKTSYDYYLTHSAEMIVMEDTILARLVRKQEQLEQSLKSEIMEGYGGDSTDVAVKDSVDIRKP